MFFPIIRTGVVASALICLLTIEYYTKNHLAFRNTTDILVLIYVIYNTISFTLFSLTGLPKSVFVQEYSSSILPIVFYYFAKNERKNNYNFYKITLYAILVSLIIGVIFFVKQPYFYRGYLSHKNGGGTSILSNTQFFRGLFGATVTGSIGAIGVLISSFYILESNGRKGKIALLICLAAALLTFRRSAMYVSLLAILGIHYIGYFKYNFIKKRYLIVELLFVLLIVLYINSKIPFLFETINDRLIMLSNAFDQRTGNWLEGLKYGNIIIGSGLGRFSHKALPYTNEIIADGNYIRMIAEIGIVGTSMFVVIIFGSLVKGLKNLHTNYLEIGIVFALCLQAIGSNIFSFQELAPIFWYSLGRLQLRSVN